MSDTFENVSAVKKANCYFDGKVTSRTILFSDGTKKTLGFMQAGEYEFGTETAELMEILGGSAEVLLPQAVEYKLFTEGNCFEVPANSKFQLKVASPGLDYCCSYF